MPHVLRRKKHVASELREKRFRGDESSHRRHAKAEERTNGGIHVDELRNPFTRQRNAVVCIAIRAARIPLVQRIEMPPDLGPYIVLLLRVADRRHRLTFAVIESRTCDVVAAAAIDRVVKTGMVGIELQKFRGIVFVDKHL